MVELGCSRTRVTRGWGHETRRDRDGSCAVGTVALLVVHRGNVPHYGLAMTVRDWLRARPRPEEVDRRAAKKVRCGAASSSRNADGVHPWVRRNADVK